MGIPATAITDAHRPSCVSQSDNFCSALLRWFAFYKLPINRYILRALIRRLRFLLLIPMNKSGTSSSGQEVFPVDRVSKTC